jgi:hypothetical protein
MGRIEGNGICAKRWMGSAGRGTYIEGAQVSEQFARTRNMFHATCYYDPISYSPLNLKRHYFSAQSASSLGLWNLATVFQRQHEFEKEKCERPCEKRGKGKYRIWKEVYVTSNCFAS